MKIAISSDTKLLPILGGAVRWEAREHGFSEADADSLASAVDEAAGNAIRQSSQPGIMLSLEMVAYPDRVELILEGSGPKVHLVKSLPPKP